MSPRRQQALTGSVPGYTATMTEQTQGATPSPHDDESTDSGASLPPAEIRSGINNFRHELGAAQAKAMEDLLNRHGVENERDLYERAGYPGRKLTLDVPIYVAEAFVLLNALDELSTQPRGASGFVPYCRLLEALIDSLAAADIEVAGAWLDSKGALKTATDDAEAGATDDQGQAPDEDPDAVDDDESADSDDEAGGADDEGAHKEGDDE